MTHWTAGQLLTGSHSKYIIEQPISQGGFGITYLAREQPAGRQVVIKTLKSELRQRRNFHQLQTKFVNEALCLARCNHPHVVKVHEVFEQAGFWHIVMDYIDGTNLAEYLKDHGAMSESEALRLIQQVGDALSYVHQQGFNHRDVKPVNIMLRRSRLDAVLIDFGLAKPLTANHLKTNTFDLNGTPFYAPIEQYKNYFEKASVGAYSDVYSLAATLYVMLTLQQPYPANIRYDSEKHTKSPLPLIAPQTYNRQISQRVNDAILKGLELLPQNRPQTMQAWLSLLPSDDQATDDLSSSCGVDYRQLQSLLRAEKWKEANTETAKVMLAATGQTEEGRFTSKSLINFPITDLKTIDRLWVKYSQGRFGFSVQRQIYVECYSNSDGHTDKAEKSFGNRVGWFSREISFSTTAPQGHFPHFGLSGPWWHDYCVRDMLFLLKREEYWAAKEGIEGILGIVFFLISSAFLPFSVPHGLAFLGVFEFYGLLYYVLFFLVYVYFLWMVVFVIKERRVQCVCWFLGLICGANFLCRILGLRPYKL